MKNPSLTSHHQLSLFQPFHSNTIEQQQKLSNLIDFWDCLPRYSISRQAMNKLRDINGQLPLLELTFEDKGIKYCVTIQAALIKCDKGGNSATAFYPSGNEELIEDALRKLAADNQGFYISKPSDPVTGVTFSMYQLREELKRCGHSRSFEEIKLSLNILSRSSIQISTTTHRSKSFVTSAYFPVMGAVSRLDMENDAESRLMVQFHPLVTECIEKLSYRQFNYDRLMRHKTQLARWLHKRLIQKYTQASITKPFVIYFSTIKRDSSMLNNYARSRSAHEACNFSVQELKNHGVLSNFDTEIKSGTRGQVLDIIYTFTPAPEFVAETIAANLRQKKLSTIS